MKRIAILLDKIIEYDARVRRTIESLSENNLVDLYCIKGKTNDSLFFNDNVTVYHYKISNSWIIKNFLFHKKFIDLIRVFSENQKAYNFIYINDYPLLYSGVILKNIFRVQLIYDSHEIYIETLNQFFPQKGWKALYGKPLTWINKTFHRKLEKKISCKLI